MRGPRAAMAAGGGEKKKRISITMKKPKRGSGMILSFDEAGALLDEMAEEFPPEFYDELNGGIALLPEAKEDPGGGARRALHHGRVLQRHDGQI